MSDTERKRPALPDIDAHEDWDRPYDPTEILGGFDTPYAALSGLDPRLPDFERVEPVLQGVAIAAQLLVTPETDAQRSGLEARWSQYEARLRADLDSPLGTLIARLGLSSFEVRTLVLLLGMHTEPLMARLVAQVEEQPLAVGITARTVVRHLVTGARERLAARRCFLPGAPMVDRHIVTLGVMEGHSEDGLLDRPLLLTGPAIRYCLGEPALPKIRTGLYHIEHPEVDLVNVVLPSRRLETVRRMVRYHHREGAGPPGESTSPGGLCILLSGPPGTGKTLLSRGLASHLDRPLLTLRATDLPAAAGLTEALRDAFADAWLTEAVVVLDRCEAVLRAEDPRRDAVIEMIDGFPGIVLLHATEANRLDQAVERRLSYHLPFPVPDISARHQIWEVHLPPELEVAEDIDLYSLASRFDFNGATIQNAVAYAIRQSATRKGRAVIGMAQLEEACLAQVPDTDGELTVRTVGSHRMTDIVLPDKARKKVTELRAACRNQGTVLSRWGFGRKLATGKGIIALFDGPPGTGKTFCAEILANELGRPLHRVNIAEVVSMWAGETEKHIRKVFQQARISHGILLFDEADSLFSSRVTETRTSSDRHANMEVNLLLQEIERFPGVCILTTNFFGTLDKALVRRIQFRVTFEEPDIEQRTEIWSVLCPSEAPLDADVDFKQLAKEFELTGAMIKNALLRAAYRSCDAGTALTMEQLRLACRDEYEAAGKLYVPERPRPRAEAPAS